MFKRVVKRVSSPQKPAKRAGRKGTRKDPKLLRAIAKVLDKTGIYHMTADKLKVGLHELQNSSLEMANLQVPCPATLRTILKESFHLKFGKSSAANPKYRDPTYNEKRLWVSRLLSQLFLEDALIISVDESNFRSDALPSRQWAFDNSALFAKSGGETKDNLTF